MKIRFFLKGFLKEILSSEELDPSNEGNITRLFERLQILRSGGTFEEEMKFSEQEMLENSQAENGTFEGLLKSASKVKFTSGLDLFYGDSLLQAAKAA